MIDIPEAALKFGFVKDPAGTHLSRTMMLTELRRLLAACPADTESVGYRRAIVDENVLLKRTTRTRAITFARLRDL